MGEAESVIYLNEAASAWPKAPGVAQAIAAETDLPLAVPGRTLWQRSDYRGECRARLAGLLGVSDASRIVLTSGATQSLNMALFGLWLPRGSTILASCAEHNSVLRPLCHLRDRKRNHLTIIGPDATGGLDLGAFGAALDRSVSLVALTHASNVTGRVYPVAQLFRWAKAHGAVTLLDASQTVGVTPVRPEELHADVVAFSCHRGLRGPIGTGGLYVAPHLELSPHHFGALDEQCEVAEHLPGMPLVLEPGTPNLPLLAGLARALRWWEEHRAPYQQTALTLGAKLRAGLGRTRGVQLCDRDWRAPRVPIVSFRVEGWEVEELGRALLQEFGIHARTGLHCAPLIHKALGSRDHGTVRFSLSGLNTEMQVQEALAAVRELAARRRSAGTGSHLPARSPQAARAGAGR